MDVRTTSPRDLLSIALAGNSYSDLDAADRVQAIEALRARLDEEEQQIAFSMRLRGSTWAQIGEVWGVTRQAAHERFRAAGLLDKLADAVGREVTP